MVTVTLPQNYGLVIAVALGAMPVLSFIHGTIVGLHRKPGKVPYPNAYASAEEARSNPKAHQFNCAQRAHANYLENMPQTMLFVLVAGLKYPNASAALGTVWLLSRVAFLYGYVYSNKPQGNGRYAGSLFWLIQGSLWGLSVFGVGRDLINF